MKVQFFIRVIVALLPAGILAANQPFTVNVDTSAAPELREWCSRARSELTVWQPRISNLLSSEGFVPPAAISLGVKKADEGIGGTSGTNIALHSGWLIKHTDYLGMVIHELTHVIQRYPKPEPGWITEGIADYIRWAIYEGKPPAWFPAPHTTNDLTRGYRMTAGFLLWMETGPCPGIVRRLNRMMREQNYTERVFTECSGKSLRALQEDYIHARNTPPQPVTGK